MSLPGASERIRAATLDLEGASVQPHRLGGEAYQLGRRELRHGHRDWLVIIPIPRPLLHEALTASPAEALPMRPDSGWVSR